MTRAVLLNPTGAVHRVAIGRDGADMTACGERYDRAAPVRPVQALAWPVDECHAPPCWGAGMWLHFVEGQGR